MMNEMGLRRGFPDQSSGSGHTFGTTRYPSIIDPILSKRVCFYKSGDPQFNGLRMVINNRSFKTFDALLDSLSKKVPLPFGVRNITTPRGVHAISTLDELEDGKSYICSDSRKVKPINLALARKKLPPWYHTRPVSSRRRTVHQARFFPGQNIHRKEPVVVRIPRRLLVFRNGDPTVKYAAVLHKRTTPTFESILEYLSELIQFHVVKLHTPDGRRVDGLTGLILCSGTVVAAGREPFRPAHYNTQKSPSPTMLPTKQKGLQRRKALKRKKKSRSHSSKSRNFSSSSERYIVNRIHNSIAEGSCDLPSNTTNSVESGHLLESVAETEADTCHGDGAGRQDCLLPTDDDIEKSFRVNQDGSMTVEMKVRLTLKEEEIIHWTTTLTRSSAANQFNATCSPQLEAEQEIGSLKSNSVDLQSPAASIDTIHKDKFEDNNDEDPPSLGNEVFSESGIEEDNFKTQMDIVSPRRPPIPEHKEIRKKQASVESIKSVTAEGIKEGMVGSYSYSEHTENGAMKEQYCIVKQSTKPVPKPRRLGSVDANNINSRNVSTFKSGMTEILQFESNGEEVTETVLHIYEQQTCQDNFLANLCAHGMSASGVPFCRPATSDTGHFSSNNDFEPEPWRPSTASESISIWRAESMSETSDLTLPSLKTGAIQATTVQQQVPMLPEGKDNPKQREVNKDKRVSSKPKVINKRVSRLMSPGKRQKQSSAEATTKRKKFKTFSSAGFIKKIYGYKSKSAKSMMRLKKGPTQNGDRGVTTKSSQQSDDTIKCILQDPNMPSALEENTIETVSFEKSRLNVAPNEVSQPRGTLTRQTSMHQEKKNTNKSYDVSESMSLPAFNSSSSVTNEYVENWLEKANLNPTAYPYEESKTLEAEAVTLAQTENGRCGESENRKNGLMIVAEEVKYLEETSEIQKCHTLTADLLPENVQSASVRQRIKSFENKVSSPSVEKTTVNQQIVYSHTTTTNTEKYLVSLAQNNIEETKPPSIHICPEIIPPTSTEMPSGSEKEKKSSPIKISLQKATPSNTLSMELPLPPPPAENTEPSNTEYFTSVASSPLYKFSSVSSQMSDNHPLSTSPTSDKAISPYDYTMEMTTSIQTDIPSTLGEPPLPRTPSIKRAPLVSNLSLDRKMSLRKACLDKYTLCSDATSGTTTSSSPINQMPNGILSTGTQQLSETSSEETQQSKKISDLKGSPTYCTSTSPASSASEERMSSVSVSTSEAQTPSDRPLKETNTNKTPLLTKKEASSPKPLVKKVKTEKSPSPERKSQTKKFSSELPHNSPKLSSTQNHPSDKTMSPNIGIRKHATPNASPSTERKIYKPKLQKRPSPYSQSLDMVSPPVRHKSSRKLLSRNLSLTENESDSTNKTQRKTSSERKGHPTPQSIKSAAELDKRSADQSDENKLNKADDLTTTDQEKSMIETQIMPQPLNLANQSNIKPMLEEICYSIKSIRQITQNKRPSCLEKSNSLPDFSSHVASTFGSSYKALLAFLSVMTLKEGLTNLNMDELNANNVSCAEALKMIDSLREIASIEDSHKLKDRLSDLQQSASKQLLQSWKGFQELGDKHKSHSSTTNDLEQELITEASPDKDCGINENVIYEIMDNLDIPEKLKDELASLSVDVKSDSEVIEKVERSPNNVKVSNFSTEDCVNVRDVSQGDKANVDVSSIITKFTDINQPKQSIQQFSMVSLAETAKHKPTDQATKDQDSQCGQNGVAICPPDEANYEQIPEERQLYSTELFVKENREDMQSCMDAVNQENQEEKIQQKGHNEDISNQGKAKMNRDVSSMKNPKQDSCISEVEEQDMEGNQQQMPSEESMSITDSELTHDDEESRESDDMTNPESLYQEEEDKQPSSNYDIQLHATVKERISSPDCHNKSMSEEEQSEDECKELSNKDALTYAVSPSNSEKEEQSKAGCMELNASVDESTCNSDVDEPLSEEEQPEVECKELKVIVEESLSGNEEERESMGEEEHRDDFPDQELKSLIEETEEDIVSSDDEDPHADKTHICDKTNSPYTAEGNLRNLIENQDCSTKKDKSLIKSDSLAKRYRFNADDDSGNDHSSCEEHVEVEQPKVEDEQISSSIKELIYYGKESNSDEEHSCMDRYIEGSCTEYQKAPALVTQSEVTKCEETVEKPMHQSGEIISQSVAERVNLLGKQVVDAQNRNNTIESSPATRSSQRNACLESDVDDSPSELPTSQSALSTQSAPQSSLSFSYDSSGVITTEPEGNRVKSIREMFLAKSATDIQYGQRRFLSQNKSERSDLGAETSASGGYQSQTSSELSSGKDDSARKSISKGFVRRTIERLYGKKDANPDEDKSERPPSAPKEKKKEHSIIFSPFQTTGTKAMSELSYFNSANALDTLGEATRCIAFNAQVRPEDSVPIDNGRWLLRENTLIRKSVSDPVGINKTFTNSPQGEGMCEDTEENTQYSLFSTKSELEDKKLLLSRCTYFSLPHASDYDACQDDLSIVSKSSANGDSITDTKDYSEDTKMWAERNGTLHSIGITDFKMKDNKVHPLTELPSDGEVVVVQPGKGQGVMNRRLPEPDMLDLLYNFCGQNCPIL